MVWAVGYGLWATWGYTTHQVGKMYTLLSSLLAMNGARIPIEISGGRLIDERWG